MVSLVRPQDFPYMALLPPKKSVIGFYFFTDLKSILRSDDPASFCIGSQMHLNKNSLLWQQSVLTRTKITCLKKSKWTFGIITWILKNIV